MKKNTIYFLICALWTLSLEAQFILNQEGEAFSELPFFNAELIAAQHIKSIEGTYTYAKGNEGFKQTTDAFRYYFNSNGRLIGTMEILQKGSAKDSIFHHYDYYPDGQLKMHRFAAYGGALCEHYSYDSLHRLASVALYRDIYDHRRDTLISSIKLRTETLRYHQGQKADYTRYNNYQRPYLEVTQTFDANQFLKSRDSYYRISQSKESTQFFYDQTGLLSRKVIFADSNTIAKEEWRYRYDQWGNLIEIHRYEKGVFATDFQIVYDYKTGFLGSLIKKDNGTNQMSIIRFTHYTYYPKP